MKVHLQINPAGSTFRKTACGLTRTAGAALDVRFPLSWSWDVTAPRSRCKRCSDAYVYWLSRWASEQDRFKTPTAPAA